MSNNHRANKDVVIQTIGLTKRYGRGESEVVALRDVSLCIERGEFVAIMGPSGSGKSTLMNILGCLDRPTTGTYLLEDEDVSSLDRARLAEIRNRHLGFVFQSYNLLSRATALKNVILPMVYVRGEIIPVHEREERAREALTAVGLGDRLDHLPSEMSGGQQQRVGIARALVNDPSVLMADEPTGNLDTASTREILDLFCDMNARGRTIVMITHEQEVADRAKRTIFLRDGSIEWDKINATRGQPDQRVPLEVMRP